MGCDSSSGRPALGILCFVSFLALKTQAAHRTCSKDLVAKVQSLIELDPDTRLPDIRLYTPSAEDFEKCPRSTLKCFAEEFKVFYEEWKTVGEPVNSHLRINTKLHKLATFHNEPEAGCRQCEICTKRNATMFLSDLKSVLQMMNQQPSCKFGTTRTPPQTSAPSREQHRNLRPDHAAPDQL